MYRDTKNKNENGKSIISFKLPDEHCFFGQDSRWQKITIPCGKCYACRLNYAKAWADRCLMESLQYDENYFVTVTYNDDFVPHASNGHLTLEPKDITDFIKRLRSDGHEFRYFYCGEYGSKSWRPHYHLIMFGLHLDDLYYWRKSDTGYPVFRSPMLESKWSLVVDGKCSDISLGNIEVGFLSYESCAYVARYCQKKVDTDKSVYDVLGIYPEFVRMSRRPGIGAEFFEKNFGDLYSWNELYLPSSKGGVKVKIPRYFDKLLEKDYPDVFEKVKAYRDSLEVESRMFIESGNTDLPLYQYQVIKERALRDKTKSLKRRI